MTTEDPDLPSPDGQRRPSGEGGIRFLASTSLSADGTWVVDTSDGASIVASSRADAEQLAVDIVRAAGGGDVLYRDRENRLYKRMAVEG